jgi:murein DD-endopeptidase MepM/ murein hydrolase activator NlpD
MKINRLFFFLLFNFLLVSFLSAQIRYSIIPESPRPGEPITIGVPSGVTEALLIINGRQAAKSLFFFVPGENGRPGFRAAVITVPSLSNPGEALIRLNSGNNTVIEIPIIIASRHFEAEVIHLDERLTGIRTDPSPERTEQANRLWAVLSTTGDQVYHTGPFLPPVISTRRTSHFGDRRVFQYSTGSRDTSVHAGVDYGVPTGTPVDACGAGRVVIAGWRIVTGFSVVLEHAPGIYSIYYHLDSILVQEGDIIRTGTRIGLSGSTGLSTGPHLHWEVRVSTENTDPDAFVHRQIIDKELIISRIYN